MKKIEPWNESDAAMWRDFLKTVSGQKLMELHKQARPNVTSDNAEAVFGEAKRQRGWEESHDFFEEKAHFTEGPVARPAHIDVDKD